MSSSTQMEIRALNRINWTLLRCLLANSYRDTTHFKYEIIAVANILLYRLHMLGLWSCFHLRHHLFGLLSRSGLRSSLRTRQSEQHEKASIAKMSPTSCFTNCTGGVPKLIATTTIWCTTITTAFPSQAKRNMFSIARGITKECK